MSYSQNQINCIRGMDISEFQGTCDFMKSKNMGIEFVIHRCINRAQKIDANIGINIPKIKAQNIYVGSYHYVNAEDFKGIQNAKVSADRYVNVLETYYSNKGLLSKWGDIYPVVDFEWPTTLTETSDTYLDWVEAYINRFKERTSLNKVIFYTYYDFIQKCNGAIHSTKGAIFKDNILWLAAKPVFYPTAFTEFGGFSDYTLWQYSSDENTLGATYGVGSTAIDLDLIRSGIPITDILIGGVDIYAK